MHEIGHDMHPKRYGGASPSLKKGGRGSEAAVETALAQALQGLTELQPQGA
jgi:hypothetical protein